MTGTNTGEARLRAEVSAATRLLNLEDIMDYSGHVSARLPGGDTFLVQDFDMPRGAVAPDNLLVADMDGNKVSGPEGLYPPAEVYIHSEILRARPDVNAVVHVHPETAILFTLADGPTLVPMRNHAARWADGIPVHPDPGHINTPELGKELADTLDGHNAALIRAHGIIVTAESVPAMFIDTVHFVENADAMYKAAQLGPVKPLTPEEMEIFTTRFRRDRHIRKLWDYYCGRAKTDGALAVDWAGDLDL